jgi:hypothetical protein
MKLKIILSLLAVVLIILGLCAIGVAAVGADNCSRSLLTPANQFANVRAAPNTTSAIKRQMQAGQTAEATGPTAGWYTLTAGGYVSASVVTATCLTQATPTRIPSSTPRARPTPIEQHIICPSACEITITVEQLP